MKKSQLRRIIRESIKELMTEQNPYTSGTKININSCNSGTPMQNFCIPNSFNGQVGDTFIVNTSHNPAQVGKEFFIRDISNNSCNITTNGVQTTVSPGTGTCNNCCIQGGYEWGSFTPSGACWNDCSATSSGCDNTMAGSCAQTWLPSNMNWPNMANFACTGNQTYSAVEQSQLVGATNLLNSNGFTGTIPSFSNYQDISNFVNSTGIGQPQKGQIKRKLAKSHWGGCMVTDCNC